MQTVEKDDVETKNTGVPRGLLKGMKRPGAVEFQSVNKEAGYGKFIAEPFEKGFGTTVGNSLRRVLMSCIEGFAVVAFKIEGISHEFGVVPGVEEDISRIILNLKKVRIRSARLSAFTIEVEKKGAGILLASDLAVDSGFEIINPNLVIAHLNEDADISLTLQVDRGRGYLPSDAAKRYIDEIGVIPIDALFSPISKVNFEVTETRVDQRTDYERLTLEVWTDMTLPPEDAVAYSAKILKEHLTVFINFEEELYEEEDDYGENSEKIQAVLNMSLEELDLSVRTISVLKSLDMKLVRDLVSKYEDDLRKSKHYSDKVILQLKSEVANLGLSFGMRDLR